MEIYESMYKYTTKQLIQNKDDKDWWNINQQYCFLREEQSFPNHKKYIIKADKTLHSVNFIKTERILIIQTHIVRSCPRHFVRFYLVVSSWIDWHTIFNTLLGSIVIAGGLRFT